MSRLDSIIRLAATEFSAIVFQMTTMTTSSKMKPILRNLFLLCGVLSFTQAAGTNINITFIPTDTSEFTDNDVTTYEDVVTRITFNVTCEDDNVSLENKTIHFTTDVDYIARITENATIDISGNCLGASGSFGVTGVRLGRAYVIASIDDYVIVDYYSVIVLRNRRLVDDIFRYGIIFLACVLYIGFGCKVRLQTIKRILKKPIAPAIGILSQFIVMPLVSGCLSTVYESFLPIYILPQIARLMGPTWCPHGSCRPQMGPMLAPSTLLSETMIKWWAGLRRLTHQCLFNFWW